MFDKNLAHYLTATGIVIKEGKYLIAKRAEWEKAFPNRWTVPGGKLKVMDYVLKKKDTAHHWYHIFEDLVRREIKEEVGLEIENLGYLASMIYIRDDEIPTIVVSLYANVLGEGSICLCSALTEYAWVSLDEAKNYDLIEGIYEELEILDKKINRGITSEWGKN